MAKCVFVITVDFRTRLDKRQEELRDIDPTVLIENEEDLTDFPSDFQLINKNMYIAYDPTALGSEGNLWACSEGECGTRDSE